MAKARQSRRPSRLGTPAGAAARPDRVTSKGAGFPGLLGEVWERAQHETGLPEAVQALLTLDGHVPADIQLRALGTAEECALKVLFGLSWREGRDVAQPVPYEADGRPAFSGAIGLATGGRLVVRVPSQPPLTDEEELVGGIIRVPWSEKALSDYSSELADATARRRLTVADCRRWLAAVEDRGELLELLKDATRRTAPLVLYQGGRRYTNFRENNNLPGKTLWPGHPDCTFSTLQNLTLDLWSDQDAELVVCLTLLVHSAGFGRIEEANGTQVTVDHVAELLERARRGYESATPGAVVPPAASKRIEHLDELAERLRLARTSLGPHAQLYREIHGPLMHKIERIAVAPSQECLSLEQRMCERLVRELPLSGDSLAVLQEQLAREPQWLVSPHGGFGTGLESLVARTVGAAVEVFGADFAMSRGMRSLRRLVEALQGEQWQCITKWELPDFFCCVMPDPAAKRHFGGSAAMLADVAWSMSSRMQYNSWHFIPGGLPPGPVVEDRDYFVPPTMPDIAYFSDQHHHGHVASHVRFSIRSPQPVKVLGRTFNGFVDLRLMRCEGSPFGEQELLAAHRVSAFVARATGLVAGLAEEGDGAEVTAFDSAWHWENIAGAAEPAVHTPSEDR